MQNQPSENRVPGFSLKFDQAFVFDVAAENNPRATVKQLSPVIGTKTPDFSIVAGEVFEFTDQVIPPSSLNPPVDKPPSQSDPAA